MTESVVENHLFRKGVWDSTISVVRTSVASVDRRFWYLLLGWGSLSLLNYMWAQYHVGKISLFDARAKTPNIDPMQEYIVVVTAVRAASWKSFIDSVLLPYTVGQHVVPWLVLKLNPKDATATQ